MFRRGSSFNDATFIYPEEKRWEVATIEGRPPGPRSAHSAVMTARKEVVIFGGYDGERMCSLNDVWVLDLVRLRWERPEINRGMGAAGEVPGPRCWHRATVIEGGRKMLVHGGTNYAPDGGICEGDVWVLDLESWRWKRQATVMGPGIEYEQLMRLSHGLTTLRREDGTSVVVVYGGYGRSGMGSTDVMLLDVGSWRWSVIERPVPVGTDGGPGPLADLSAVELPVRFSSSFSSSSFPPIHSFAFTTFHSIRVGLSPHKQQRGGKGTNGAKIILMGGRVCPAGGEIDATEAYKRAQHAFVMHLH